MKRFRDIEWEDFYTRNYWPCQPDPDGETTLSSDEEIMITCLEGIRKAL